MSVSYREKELLTSTSERELIPTLTYLEASEGSDLPISLTAYTLKQYSSLLVSLVTTVVVSVIVSVLLYTTHFSFFLDLKYLLTCHYLS